MPTAEAVFIDLLKVDTKKKNPCWKGYEQVGFKMKNGRRVPNCVPIKRSRKAGDVAPPRKADELAKIKDDEGHEHGSDGRFVSTGGGSGAKGDKPEISAKPKTAHVGYTGSDHDYQRMVQAESWIDNFLHSDDDDSATDLNENADHVSLDEGRDFLKEDAKYDVVVLHHIFQDKLPEKKRTQLTEMLGQPDHVFRVSEEHDPSRWRDRLASTKANYLFVFGDDTAVNGSYVGDIPGYKLLEYDGHIAVYSKQEDEPKKTRREPKNEREENILKHVKQMAQYGKLIGMPPEHQAFYQRLLDEGEWYRPAELPEDVPEGEHKMCFMNSFQNAQYRNMDYVEGIAHGIIPLHHAWNAKPGVYQARDSTWQRHDPRESLVKPKEAAYLGIRVPHEERMKAALLHGTYGVYLKDEPRPKKKRVKKSGTPMKNVPADWKNEYEMYPNERHEPVARNRTYPLDGRQTVWPPYEMYMPTRTAGEMLDAVKAVGHDGSLPEDFADYLRQRVPSFDALKAVDPSTKIDLCGKMVTHDSE